MKLAYIDLCGFRGIQKRVRIDFAPSFTIIDGRNGVGKSTIFDAVEFALTGTVSKYLDAKASGESVDDYIWWSGTIPPSGPNYVEVAFLDGKTIHKIRRTDREPRSFEIGELGDLLIDRRTAPKSAIEQICTATIIRDEHIARLSLDLKETDRFTLLRDAIGAIDAEEWINRAQQLHSLAASRARSAQEEVSVSNAALLTARRQIDQARLAMPSSSVVADATKSLQRLLRSGAPVEGLGDIARARLAALAQRLELVERLSLQATNIQSLREDVPKIALEADRASTALRIAQEELATREGRVVEMPPSTILSRRARQLERLVAIGAEIGRIDGRCPLCASDIDHTHFQEGMDAAIAAAKSLDANAVEQAQRESARDAAHEALTEAEKASGAAIARQSVVQSAIADFEARCAAANLSGNDPQALTLETTNLERERAAITAELRIIDTVGVGRLLSRASEEEAVARDQVARAEARLGRARLSETGAKAIYDAARRAAAETLDQRLDRVLPLMSELYQRLRPHPIWTDIEYSIRGDVRRFLKLQVGDEINPQFVFSSGQRRATGLAFLLSVNLSIAWSRWNSILLDDPVQHIDDFRTVHLVEVLSHLCASGKQIVCAVEDSALADLMCRRLPTSEQSEAKRVTLEFTRTAHLGPLRKGSFRR